METPTYNNLSDDIEQQEPNPEDLSPIRMALRDTILGLYLDTNNRRYLLAFLLYLAAFATFAGVIIHVVVALSSGGFFQQDNHGFWGRLFVIAGVISGLVTLGSLSAYRYALFFQSLIMTTFLILLSVWRP